MPADPEALLDDIARVYARAAVDAFLKEQSAADSPCPPGDASPAPRLSACGTGAFYTQAKAPDNEGASNGGR
jgi:hypothetical protein